MDGGKIFNCRRWRVDGGDEYVMWIVFYDGKIFYLGID